MGTGYFHPQQYKGDGDGDGFTLVNSSHQGYLWAKMPAVKPAPTQHETPPERQVKRRNRSITPEDVQDMADLLAKRLNESEACQVLGIKVRSWFRWKEKAKNNGKLAALVSRIKGVKIRACMEGIEAAGQKDWRALDRLLERIKPEEFADRNTGGPALVQIFNSESIQRGLRSVYGQPALVVSDPPKQLSDTQPVAVSKEVMTTTSKPA